LLSKIVMFNIINHKYTFIKMLNKIIYYFFTITFNFSVFGKGQFNFSKNKFVKVFSKYKRFL